MTRQHELLSLSLPCLARTLIQAVCCVNTRQTGTLACPTRRCCRVRCCRRLCPRPVRRGAAPPAGAAPAPRPWGLLAPAPPSAAPRPARRPPGRGEWAGRGVWAGATGERTIELLSTHAQPPSAGYGHHGGRPALHTLAAAALTASRASTAFKGSVRARRRRASTRWSECEGSCTCWVVAAQGSICGRSAGGRQPACSLTALHQAAPARGPTQQRACMSASRCWSRAKLSCSRAARTPAEAAPGRHEWVRQPASRPKTAAIRACKQAGTRHAASSRQRT